LQSHTHTQTLRKASIVQAVVGLRLEYSPSVHHPPQPPSFFLICSFYIFIVPLPTSSKSSSSSLSFSSSSYNPQITINAVYRYSPILAPNSLNNQSPASPTTSSGGSGTCTMPSNSSSSSFLHPPSFKTASASHISQKFVLILLLYFMSSLNNRN
jgi:hypothetical protein